MTERNSSSHLAAGAVLLAAAAYAAAAAGKPAGGEEARRILSAAGTTGGLIVHVGCDGGAVRRTIALRAGPGDLVLGLCRGAAGVQAARRKVLDAGLGGKVTIHAWQPKRLPLADNIANLIVVEEGQPVSPDEIARALCPDGVALVSEGGKWTRTTKRRPGDIDEWTHYLHDAGGNAVAADSRVGPPRHMQWLAGPRWMRNHHYLASISAIVSGGGRLFYILDEGPSANMDVPGKWAILARDAFNGVRLWKRPIASWANWRRGFRSGPVQLPRTLVAGGGRVYLPLGVNAPLSALDAATGREIRTYPQTKGIEEVLLDGDVLLVVAGSPTTAQQAAGTRRRPRKPKPAAKDKTKPTSPGRKPAAASYVRTILAVEADRGKTLWRGAADQGNPEPMTLATDGRRVFFQLGGGVVCLDRASGKERWRSPKARGGRRTPLFMTGATLVVRDGVVLSADGRALTVFAADSGRRLWSCPARAGFRSPTDVFVAQGLVWLGPNFAQGRDLKTGQVRKTNVGVRAIQTAGHHHRCYREKATERYVLAGHRGIEFLDLAGENHSRNNWTRGACQYGVLPCNGLVYAPPHACGCYMEAKLSGFWAMSAGRGPAAPFEGPRLAKGPAYDNRQPSIPNPQSTAWPTYRHDATRSGSTRTSVPTRLEQSWRANVGGPPTAPVVAGQTVVVASRATHEVVALDAASGRRRWSFIAGGRVDSPPTIDGRRVLFGSADGWVHCLRLSDGRRVWRFFAAPERRLTVAMEQVESVWPVHGSVLVAGGAAYFAAGRSSYLDGGIALYALDPATGKVLHHRTLRGEHPVGSGVSPEDEPKHPRKKIVQNATDAKTFAAPDRSDAFSMASGTITDVMVSDGRSVFLRHVRFDRELSPQKTMARHLFSTSQLVDATENHRIHWVLGTGDFSRVPVAYSWIVNRGGFGSRFRSAPAVPFGLLLTFDAERVLGVRRPDGFKGYELTAWANRPFSPDEKAEPDFRWVQPGEARKPTWAWSVPLAIRPRSIVLAADTVVLGGAPYVVDRDDPHGAYEGRKGGLLWLMAARDGAKLAEHKLASPVVWNGLAAANGRLYVATRDGSVLCLGGK